MILPPQSLAAARDQISAIILGSIFLFIGLAACAIAGIRGFRGGRLLLWQGIFSALYGARVVLRQAPLILSLLPQPAWHLRLAITQAITYIIVIPALLFWLELSRGVFRRILQATLLIALVLGAAGIGYIALTDSPQRLMPLSSVLDIWVLLLLAGAHGSRRLAKRYLSFYSRTAAVGVLVSAVAAIYTNLQPFLRLPAYPALEPIAIAAFLMTLGYVVVQKVIFDQRRLLSIEGELAIAREIQTSILPTEVPGQDGLAIAATYRPMTEVAGDFYEFVAIDRNRIGFLVADVSGHGVPAALIASMIKVAMQSVVPHASDPGTVLRGLSRSLSGQLRNHFVSAAYLLIDTQDGMARYSAAGHPPLLLWRDGRLERIESNGILFGVLPDPEYPVLEFPIRIGDRFLLSTDGATEPENAGGESFGDHFLAEVLQRNPSAAPQKLLDQILDAIRRWQPAGLPQQDDITMIAIDVVRGAATRP